MSEPAETSRPHVRASHTHTVEVGAEALVVDHRTKAIHRLSPPVAAVWRSLDGRPLDRLVAELAEGTGTDPRTVRPGVRAAVESLRSEGLVSESSERTSLGTWEIAEDRDVDIAGDPVQVVADGLLRDVAALEVVAQLRERGIPSILLKGPAIALWLYRRGQRSYVDIDLLVPPEAVDEASEVLVATGFELEGGSPQPGDRWRHAVPWRRHRDGVGIDLHTFVVGPSRSPAEQWRIFAEHRQQLDLLGLPIDVLDEPGRLLHLALHLSHDPRQQRAKKLRDLRRALGMTSQEAWVAAAAIAEELEASEAMGVGLRAIEEGAALADRLELPASADPPLARVLRVVRAGSLVEVVRFVVWMIVPPRDHLLRWAPFEVHGRWDLIRLYLYRVVFVVWEGAKVLPRVWKSKRHTRRARPGDGPPS